MLAQRMLGRQPPQLCYQLAMRAQAQIGADAGPCKAGCSRQAAL
jgi:hypothetical protein